MSKHKPETRQEFIAKCLRQLGAPVIQINVAVDQIEDCVEDALERTQYETYNGGVHLYVPLTITEDGLKNGFPIDDKFVSVKRLLEVSGAGTGTTPSNILSPEFMLQSQASQFTLKGGGMLTLYMAQMYQNDFKQMVTGKSHHIRFTRHMDRVFVDKTNLVPGQHVVVEAFMRLDPDEFPQIWQDQFLLRYTVALIKRVWGNNLRKLQGVTLVGGVTIDGLQILQEAEAELEKIESELTSRYQEPIDAFMA